MTPLIIQAADLFCGAGGTSTGLVQACHELGLGVDLTAINHWDMAIATHTANHPEARNLCTGVDAVNPRDLFPGGKLDLLWASPECTHHSVARGGRPMSDQSRATAWCVLRWADALRPANILIENVPEFLGWGPLDADNRPIPAKKGETFRAWVAAVESMGYTAEWRILRAADYGDPTTRRRLFVQFVRAGQRVHWPAPTHAEKPTAEQLAAGILPWRTAREIIDWSLPGTSIFTRARPLSAKTLRRIEAGLRKFGLKDFVVAWDHQSSPVGEWSADAPLGTITTKQRHGVIQPFLVKFHGDHKGKEDGSRRVHDLGDPVPTLDTSNRMGVVQPYLVELRGTSDQQLADTARPLSAPIPAITAGGGHVGLCEPFLIPQQAGGAPAHSVDKPLSTVTTAGAHAVVHPFLVQCAHGNGADANGDERRTKTVDAPLPTVTGSRGDWAKVEPFLVEYYGTGSATSIDAPVGTATTKPRFGLVMPVVTINGQRYHLDIRFRMLQPHELAAAQGFPSGYKFEGNKTQTVRQIGNAVPCGLARALVRAALGHNLAALPAPLEATA